MILFMKQKIKITAVIKNNDKILLLRRRNGDFELPQSKMSAGEQPEQCLLRVILDIFDVPPVSLSIIDVITYFDDAGPKPAYYVFILYDVKFSSYGKLQISDNNSKYSEMVFYSLKGNSSHPAISIGSEFILNVLSQEKGPLVIRNVMPDSADSFVDDYTLYADGGSRGNPGVSAAAYVIYKNDQVIDSGGEFLGITNNSQAEYHGLRLGLEAAASYNIKSLTVELDNLMVVCQMNGIYKVKNRELWPIYTKIKDLSKQFDSLSIQHIKREYNVAADRKVNEILDAVK